MVLIDHAKYTINFKNKARKLERPFKRGEKSMA